jgi:hypothetical protein
MNSTQTPLLTPKEINEHRRILLGFNFSEKDLRTNAQSALLVLAANMPMTLGVHTRVLARISGSGLLTLFFANVDYLRAFIAHLCHRPVPNREHEDYLNLRLQEALNEKADGSAVETFFGKQVELEMMNMAGDKAIRNGYCNGGVGIGSVIHGAVEKELNAPGGFGLGVWIGDRKDGGKGVYCAGRVFMRMASGLEFMEGHF